MAKTSNNLDNTDKNFLATPAVIEMLSREKKRLTNTRIIFLLGALIILIFYYRQSEINFLALFQSRGNMVEYIQSYFPPDFSDWKIYLEDTIITISMGIWGTFLAAIAGFPFSLLAS